MAPGPSCIRLSGGSLGPEYRPEDCDPAQTQGGCPPAFRGAGDLLMMKMWRGDGRRDPGTPACRLLAFGEHDTRVETFRRHLALGSAARGFQGWRVFSFGAHDIHVETSHPRLLECRTARGGSLKNLSRPR